MATDTGKAVLRQCADAWRHAALGILVAVSLGAMLSLEPIRQPLAYHAFADTRRFLGVPNFLDVVSNLPFLIVGVLGLLACGRSDGVLRLAWGAFFGGVALVSAGSAFYHWQPTNASLVWDRLPMTVGFMGLFTAVVGEHVGRRLAAAVLGPSVAVGLATVLYWQATDDLRPYLWVQLLPLITVPAVVVLFPNPASRPLLLLAAVGSYLLAKAAEVQDVAVYEATGRLVSGHTLKHLLSAAACWTIVWMLRRRGRSEATRGS